MTLGGGIGELSLHYVNVSPGYRSLPAQSPTINWAVRDAYLLNTNFERQTHFASGLYYSHFGRFATRYNTACADIYGRSETKYNERFSSPFMMSIYSPVDLHEYLSNLSLNPVWPLGKATYDRAGLTGSLSGNPRQWLGYSLGGAAMKNADDVLLYEAGAEARTRMPSPLSFARQPWSARAGIRLSGIDGEGVVQNMNSTVVALDHNGSYTTPVNKSLVVEGERVSSKMVSGGISAGIYKDVSVVGGMQLLSTDFDYTKRFDVSGYDPWLDGMRVTADSVKFGRNYRETADGYTLRQIHYGGGLVWRTSERVSLRLDLRRLSYLPVNPSHLVRTRVTRVEQTIDGQTTSYESTDPSETYDLPPVEKYDITMIELIFDYHF